MKKKVCQALLQDSPCKSFGVGCHSLLQGIFSTQGSKPGLPHCRQSLYHLNHQGSPCYSHTQRQTQPEQSPELPPDLRAGAQSLRTQSQCLTPSAGNRNRIHLFWDLDTESGRALLPPFSSGSGGGRRAGVEEGHRLGGPRSGCLCPPPQPQASACRSHHCPDVSGAFHSRDFLRPRGNVRLNANGLQK